MSLDKRPNRKTPGILPSDDEDPKKVDNIDPMDDDDPRKEDTLPMEDDEPKDCPHCPNYKDKIQDLK